LKWLIPKPGFGTTGSQSYGILSVRLQLFAQKRSKLGGSFSSRICCQRAEKKNVKLQV